MARSPEQRLDHNLGSVGLVAEQPWSVAALFDALARGATPDELTSWSVDLDERWINRIAGTVRDIVMEHDDRQFAVSLALADLVGEPIPTTRCTMTGMGFGLADDLQPEHLVEVLARRIETVGTPTIVIICPEDPDREQLYSQLIHTEHGVCSEIVSNIHLPATAPLSGDDARRLIDMGWHVPDVDADLPNFWRDDIGPDHLRPALRRLLWSMTDVLGVVFEEPITIEFTRSKMHYEVFDTPHGPRILPAVPAGHDEEST